MHPAPIAPGNGCRYAVKCPIAVWNPSHIRRDDERGPACRFGVADDMKIIGAWKAFLLLCLLAIVLLHGCKLGTGTDSRKAREFQKEIETGEQLIEKGRKKAALDAFDKALASMPSDFDAFATVIAILMGEEMYEESIPYIKRAIAVPPRGKSRSHLERERLQDSGMYTALGDVYYHLKKVDLAERAYRRAVRLNGRNATVYNNWGYMYADLGIKPDEALRLTKRAVDLDPGNGCFIDSLGWAYYRKGRTKNALELLKKAVELYPSDADVRYHLGKAYEAQGDMKSAWIEYQKATALSPPHRSGSNTGTGK